jgi:hypothetical protein
VATSQVLGGPVPVVDKALASSRSKNPRTVVTQIEEDERRSPTPEEGLRLVKAFLRIDNAPLRDAIVKIVEQLSINGSG